MAQVIGYYENNVTFTEGPFVICNPLANGWRIEVELKGHHCPVLPDLSICRLMESHGWHGKTHDENKAADICDWLNGLVRCGSIVLYGNSWEAAR